MRNALVKLCVMCSLYRILLGLFFVFFLSIPEKIFIASTSTIYMNWIRSANAHYEINTDDILLSIFYLLLFSRHPYPYSFQLVLVIFFHTFQYNIRCSRLWVIFHFINMRKCFSLHSRLMVLNITWLISFWEELWNYISVCFEY